MYITCINLHMHIKYVMFTCSMLPSWFQASHFALPTKSNIPGLSLVHGPRVAWTETRMHHSYANNRNNSCYIVPYVHTAVVMESSNSAATEDNYTTPFLHRRFCRPTIHVKFSLPSDLLIESIEFKLGLISRILLELGHSLCCRLQLCTPSQPASGYMELPAPLWLELKCMALHKHISMHKSEVK